MAFGLSFGKKKTKIDQTSEVDKTESTNQQQTGTRSSTGTTTGTSSSQGTSSSTGQQTSAQTGTSQTTGSTTGTTSQTTTAFSDPVLQGIEKVVTDLFGSVGGRPTISDFDPRAFVEQGVAAATADINSGLESNINQLVSNVGGATGNNSMAALLSNRLRNDAAAEASGVRANLTREAEGIQRENVLAGNAVAATDQGFLGQLLGALKGGQVTTTGQQTQQTSQNQQTQNTGTTNTAEQTAQQQSAQQTQTQQLVEMMQQLLSGTTNTQGTEKTKGTTSQGGGGFSLGF